MGEIVVEMDNKEEGGAGKGKVGVVSTPQHKEGKRVTLQEEIMDVKTLEGFRVYSVTLVLFWVLVVCTCGVLYLLYHWYQKQAIRIIYKRAPLSQAHYVLVTGHDHHSQFCRVFPLQAHLVKGDLATIDALPVEERMFVFKHIRYQYDAENETFQPILNPKVLVERYVDNVFRPLTSKEHKEIQNRVGVNLIDIPVAPIPVLLFREVLHPFFIFQIYSAILWCTELYYIYAAIIIFMALVTAVLGLWEVRNNLLSIRKLSRYECRLTVVRDDAEVEISSIDLVPGDVVVVQQSAVLPCDMAVLSGSCVVDESMLTGESTPVLKVPIPNRVNPEEIDPRHMLYGGTKTSEVRVAKGGKMTAVVMSSGFQTSKGYLVLSILFPKPTHFKFVQESLRFLIGLFAIAMIGFGLVVWQLTILGTDAGTIVQRGFDLITVVLPPALPMAASVGTAFAVGHLRKNKIFCVSLPRINMAGKINYMCFDKTGTLTEEGLDLLGCLPSIDASFGEFGTHVAPLPHTMKVGMMTCHSLTHVAGVVSGEALELKIFQATGSRLEEPHVTQDFDNTYLSVVRGEAGNYGVLTQFEFIPQLQRMGVLVHSLQHNTSLVIVKGSPEMIYELSVKDTIPPNYVEELKKYTQQGYRVLAMAYRPWNNAYDPACDKTKLRVEVETDLLFLGFIVMQNRLKPETAGVIAQLSRARIRSVMVTGDNILTAVCIAKECLIAAPDANIFLVDVVEPAPRAAGGGEGAGSSAGVDQGGEESNKPVIKIVHATNPLITLDPVSLKPSESVGNFELAVTGKAFSLMLEDFKNKGSKYPFEKIVTGGAVWARMSPDNKAALVDELMALGWYCGMCGDGANDCIALRSAHVGVSLSQAEASVSAPFTSQVTNITCIPILLREGRSALATAFQLFRFMALYSMIQFTNAVLLNFNAGFLGNWEYLYQDLWVVFPLAVLMGRSLAATKLTKKRPSGRLFSSHNLSTTAMHILLTIGFQIIIYFNVQQQDWYYVIDNTNNDELETNSTIFENSSIWFFASFQYMCVALMFTVERKFKQPIWSNYLFMVWWAITSITSFLLLFVYEDIVFAWFQIVYMPLAWRRTILWMAVVNCACYVAVEMILGFAKEKGLFSLGRKMKKHKVVQQQYRMLFSGNAK